LLLFLAAIAALIGAAILQFAQRLVIAGWLLVVPTPAGGWSFYRSLWALGGFTLGGVEGVEALLPVFGIVFLLSLFAALRPKWRWLFWIAWLPNALVVRFMWEMLYCGVALPHC
jgi:hypothetical protein